MKTAQTTRETRDGNPGTAVDAVAGSPKVKRGRPVMAAVGCALILMTGFGAMSVYNAMAPLLQAGMSTTLSGYSFGPMIATIAAFVGSLIGARVIDRIGTRVCMLLGTLCIGVALVLSGLATEPWLWYVANLFNGFTLAFGAQAAAAGVIAEFYGDRAPSVFGVVVGVMAFLLAGEVALESALLAQFDYRTVLYIFAAVSVAIGLFANLVLIGPRGKAGVRGEEGGATQVDLEARSDENVEGVTLSEALRSPVLYLFFLAMFAAAFPYQGYSAYGAYYFTNGGLSASVSAALLSAYALFTALLSLGAGVASRKFGASATAVVVFVFFAIGIALTIWWGSNGIFPIVVAGVFFGAFSGLVQTLPALFTPQIFGMRDYTAINAVGISGMHCGSAVVFIVLATIMDTFGYDAGFWLLAVAGIVAMALFLVCKAASPLRKKDR